MEGSGLPSKAPGASGFLVFTDRIIPGFQSTSAGADRVWPLTSGGTATNVGTWGESSLPFRDLEIQGDTVDGQNPFRTTLKTREGSACWYLAGNRIIPLDF